MISDLGIYRAANLVIKRYGADAVIQAVRMVDRMLELGDLEGRELRRRICRAILVLGPGHSASIVSLVSDQPESPATYKARLAGIAGLSHVTVEVQSCPGEH